MLKFFSIIFAICIALLSNAQNSDFVWAKQMGGSESDVGNYITTDASGNVYTVGQFAGTVDFDPGDDELNFTSLGFGDIFIQKLDADGNFLWAKHIGGSSTDYAFSIATDTDGNVYTTGYFSEIAEFDTGAGVEVFTSFGFADIFVLKLDSDGNFLWLKQMGGSDYAGGYGITTDINGGVYTVGDFEGTVDFDPSVEVQNLTSEGEKDIFVQKLDTDGNFLWAKRMGGVDTDRAFSVAADKDGNVYTTGYFEETADFDPGSGVESFSSNGKNDIFIQKLDADGNFVWAKQMGGSGSDNAHDNAIDADGNIYTTGYFSKKVDLDPSEDVEEFTCDDWSDVFVQKLDSDGNFVWAKQMGGSFLIIAYGITTDASGNIYTTGYFEGTADFDPSEEVESITTTGFRNVFIQKLDSEGNYIWAEQIGGSSIDRGYAITADVSGNIYTTGLFENTADFDLNEGVQNLTSNGAGDVFILKLEGGCPSLIGEDVRNECSPYVWIDGNTYTESNNTATFNIAGGASNGCDSLVTLDLTINDVAMGVDVISECSSYTWIDGNTYTESNNAATFNIVGGASNGCDSLVTLDLTINDVAMGVDVISECSSYTWIDGNTYTESNNAATFNIVGGASNGCDSLVILNLTINDVAMGVDVKSECSSYTWIDGNTYIESNNTATFNIVSGASSGCDSLVTLNLTIKNIDDITTSVDGFTISANNSNATYQWLDCDDDNTLLTGETNQDFTATINGNYAVEITENGCADTSMCVAITTLGSIENFLDGKFAFYPNPTKGNFVIEFEEIKEYLFVRLFSISGQLILNENFQETNFVKLEINHPNGIYILEILDGNGKKALLKLVKE